MLPTGANKRSLTRVFILAAACLALFAAGCSADEPQEAGNALGGEKLAFLENDGAYSRIRLSGLGTAPDQMIIEWPESSERYVARADGPYFSLRWPDSGGPGADITRFSFSRDGRYLAVSPPAAQGGSRPLVVATDGSHVRRLPRDSFWPRLSPDGKLVSYNRSSGGSAWPNITAVLEVAGGGETILADGHEPRAAFWLDEQTLIYTDLQDGAQQKQNSVYMQNVNSRERKALTPAGRDFSFYAPVVDYPLRKLALMEFVYHNNIWTMDLDTGSLTQITNNSRMKQNAMYLPDMKTILFQDSPQGLDPGMVSDIFLVRDDGRGMSMLVGEYFFLNSLYTVSGSSGRIAYQHIEDGEASIWVSEGGGRTRIAASDSAWLGDPGFAPVAQWREPNPLWMTINRQGSGPGPVFIQITNSTEEPKQGTLRLFPGPDLGLAAEGEQANTAAYGSPLVIPVQLGPGESTQILHLAQLQNSGQNLDATLLITLAVPGSPPVMSWLDISD